jgi:hypothetical protein
MYVFQTLSLKNPKWSSLVYNPATDAVGGLLNLPFSSVKINLSKYADAENTVNNDCEFAEPNDELIDELTFDIDVLTELLRVNNEPLTLPLNTPIVPLTDELTLPIVPLTLPLNVNIEPLTDELTLPIVPLTDELTCTIVPLTEDETAANEALISAEDDAI